MPSHKWSHLTRQQVGAYAEYFVKMEFTMLGFQVYRSEVDDRGVDFVVRFGRGPFLEAQVKSLRATGYTFLQKAKFHLHEHRYLALVLLFEGQPPDLYLVPSTVWLAPDGMFVDRDYEGLQSKPEWGLNLSRKHLPSLRPYRFAEVAAGLTASAPV